MGYIKTIYEAGDDALGYEFVITFAPIGALEAIAPDFANLALRVNNVNIPAQERGEYTIEYKTRTLVKPNGKITTPTEFDFEFRVDKNWVYYKFFDAWLKAVSSDTSVGRDAGGNLRTSMTVKTVDANGWYTGNVWVFDGCWPKSLAGVGLDNSSADPVNCQIQMCYYDMTVI